MLFLKFYFLDYFNNYPYLNQCFNIRNSSIKGEYFYLNNCFFKNFFVNGRGSVFYAVSINTTFILKNCLFSNCISTERGGAFFLQFVNHIFLNKICGYRCYSTSNFYGNFFYTWTSNISRHEISFLSITQCSNISNNCVSSFLVYEGHQIGNNINSSYNKTPNASGFFTVISRSLLLSYSNFIGNDNNHYSTTIFNNFNSAILNKINFISNSPSNYIIYSISVDISLKINECYFNNNLGILFYSQYQSLEISNCFIYHLNNLNLTNHILINNNYNSNLTINIKHFNTYYCLTSYYYSSILKKKKKFQLILIYINLI